MKNTLRIATVSLSAIVLFSCSLEDNLQPVESPISEIGRHEVIVTATMDEGSANATRTSMVTDSLNKPVAINWTPGDSIKVFSCGDESKFVSLNTVPSRIARFKGNVGFVTGADDGEEISYVWGLYPYREDATYSEPEPGVSRTATITTTLPALQTGKAGSFDEGLAITIGRSESLSIPFKTVYTLMRFSLTRDDIKSVSFKGKDGEALAGRFTVGMDDTADPPVPIVRSIESPETEITMKMADGSTFEPGKYYYFVMLPTILLNGFTYTLTRADGMKGIFEVKVNQPITLSRNRFSNTADIDSEKYIPASSWAMEYVDIPDANFKAYLVANFDKDQDGEINISEAEEITHIQVSTENIESVNGIEYMPNLEYLNCYTNQYGDQWDGKLTSIDVSHNTKLKELRIFGNQITDLDLSQNKLLTHLEVYNNYITDLDVSGLTELLHLDCHNNSLSILDVSINKELTFLNCYGNPLSTLFIANSQEIPGITTDRSEDYIPAETEIKVVGEEVPGIVSLSFIPQVTVNGTPGFAYASLAYQPLSSRGIDSSSETWTAAGYESAATPPVFVQYHVNGTNTSLDDTFEYSFEIKPNTPAISRALASSDFSMIPTFHSYNDGVLTLKVDITGKEATEEYNTLFALRIRKGDFSVVSDYNSTIVSNEYGDMRIACPKAVSQSKYDSNHMHYRRGTIGIGSADPEAWFIPAAWTSTFDYDNCDVSVAFNSSIDLRTLVTVHYRPSDATGYENEWEMSSSYMESAGLSFTFELVDNYSLGSPAYDQKLFATLSDNILTPRPDALSVGHTPIVRVKLMHDEDIVQVAYIKVNIISPVRATVAETLNISDHTLVEVNGTVVATDVVGFVLEQDNARIWVYGNHSSNVVVGDNVKVVGEKETYREMPEIKFPTVTITSSGNPVDRPSPVDISTSVDSFSSTNMEYVTISGVLKYNGGYYYIMPTDGSQVTLTIHQPIEDISLFNGMDVTVTGYYVYHNDNRNRMFISATDINGVSITGSSETL